MRKNIVYSAFRAFTYFLLTSFILLYSSTSFSQTISATIDRDKILIGEQVTLQLKADVNERDYSMVAWYNLPDTINHLEIVKRGNMDTLESNGSVSYQQNITITSFDSGLWKFPLLQIVLQDKASGKQVTFKADTLSLQVIPVDVSNMKEYHDIKNIIAVTPPSNNDWIIYAIASAILILLIILIASGLKKRKKKPVTLPQKPLYKGSPLDWAIEQLNILEKENLIAKNQTKLFYTKLDEIYRTYFDMQLTIHAQQLTGDELIIHLKVYLLEEKIRTPFYQVVRLCDAVKFAKYDPAASENTESIIQVRRTLQYVDETIHNMKRNNAY